MWFIPACTRTRYDSKHMLVVEIIQSWSLKVFEFCLTGFLSVVNIKRVIVPTTVGDSETSVVDLIGQDKWWSDFQPIGSSAPFEETPPPLC